MDYFFNFDKLVYLRGQKPEGCILCLVAQGNQEVESLTVWQTDLAFVSLNLYPYNPGHLLVFPRRHVVDLRELSQAERLEIDRLTMLSFDVLDAMQAPAGYNVGYNMGRVAGASIDHLHLHIIPRYPREIGIAELLAGKRVLVQDLRDTQAVLAAAFTAAAG